MFELLSRQESNISEQNIYCFSLNDTGDHFDEKK